MESVPHYTKARPRDGSDRGRFCLLGKKASSYRGAYRVPLFSQSICNIRGFCCLRELYEADKKKLGIYGSGRVWANAWDVFRRTPCRGGHGRRAAFDFLVCLGFSGISCFFLVFFFERSRPPASMRQPCLIHLSTCIVLTSPFSIGRSI